MKRGLSVLALVILGLAEMASAGDSAKATLEITEGVSAYDVSLEKGEALVTYDPEKTAPAKIAASVSRTGFVASVKQAAASQKAK